MNTTCVYKTHGYQYKSAFKVVNKGKLKKITTLFQKVNVENEFN